MEENRIIHWMYAIAFQHWSDTYFERVVQFCADWQPSVQDEFLIETVRDLIIRSRREHGTDS